MNECYGKTAYGSWGEADAVRARIEGKWRIRKYGRSSAEDRLRPYRCEYCHKFHLGNSFGMDEDGIPSAPKSFRERGRKRPIDID